MRRSFAEEIRKAAVGMEQFTMKDMVAFFHDRDENRIKIKRAIDRLRRTGEVVSIKWGVYRYQERRKPFTKADKIWRAIWIKKIFTKSDICKLSGASYSYINRFVAALQHEGFIIHVSGYGYRNALYELSDPDNTPLNQPVNSKGRLVNSPERSRP